MADGSELTTLSRAIACIPTGLYIVTTLVDGKPIGFVASFLMQMGFAPPTLCVAVEVLLWAANVFHWEYWWWNFPNVPLIILLGYATFFGTAAWVYDMRERSRQIKVVGTLAAIDVALILAFGPILEWI